MFKSGFQLVAVVCLVGVLLASGAQAQNCNPATAGDALGDEKLVAALGELACKVPASVNLVDTMNRLSANLKNMDLQQLQQLPELIKVVITRSPAELKPFFSLSGKELNALTPMVQGVPADTLKVVMPLLAQQQPATVARMLSFLKGVSRSQLEALAPMFGSITQQQVDLMVTAVNTLPPHLLQKLSGMVGGLGPVQSVAVATPQQRTTMTPVFSIGTAGGMKFGPWGGGISFGSGSGSGSGSGGSGGYSLGGAGAGLQLGGARLSLGRKLQQDGCVPFLKAFEVSGALTSNRDIGAAVCKFTPAKLLPVMTQILTILGSQSSKTLANLPAFTQLLGSTRPEVFGAIGRIPRPTLSALLSVQGADSNVVVAQLKTLAAQDAETISKLVFFTKQTPPNKFGLLISMFARISDSQAATLARLMNSLSAGQIVLSMQLLEKFNFGVGNIGQSIPAASSRGSSFNIGPFIRVTTGGRSAGVGPLRFGMLG
ncbi:hypothetical protein OEZ85_005565 [Tetradesmus obliquus]|uniref:Magnesium transporter MgtE intracellular domain-containing protein n=1 Tax=Tetradesmus obliquus TaxID=3088 RepID=A0ABY8UG33_TETOB|nr:hypothetical protein OEZ85_005565 [Tetradesmus obliquus]